MKRLALNTLVALAASVALFAANPSAAASSGATIPDVSDSTHATPKTAAFFESFFTAKSRHDVNATMNHFSTESLTYIDAALGWPFYSHEALKGVFAQYMPQWPAAGLSYPTRIYGDEHSALVAFTDTPELFGGEIRILAAIDLDKGKIVRWVDYWDGRHFGADLAAKMRTPADKFPTDFKESSAPSNASAKIRTVASKLHAAFANNDAKLASAMFSDDAVYEDMTLRTQVMGKLAIKRYLARALAKLPGGSGSTIRHVVGSDMGGGFEWQTAPKYEKTVRRGITAVALDKDGKITRLTTVWDGALLAQAEVQALTVLSIE